MLRVFRFGLIICIVIFFHNTYKKSKKQKQKKILILILSMLMLIIPYEKMFLKFDTPEKAFYFTVNYAKIIKIVEQKQSALVIYEEKKDSTSAALIKNCNGKWKSSVIPAKQILSRLGFNQTFLITKERGSNCFYIMISVASETKLVADNQNSNFELFKDDGIYKDYVAYINNCTDNYYVKIDNEQYEIDIT